jgi:gliding motility-associated-like protein
MSFPSLIAFSPASSVPRRGRVFPVKPLLLGLFLFFPSSARSALVMDDFNDATSGNLFGAGEGSLSTAQLSFHSPGLGDAGHARAIAYNAASGADGYYSDRSGADLRAYKYVSFWIRGQAGGEDLYLLVDDNAAFPKVRIKSFLPAGITTQWQKVVVSTEAFWAWTPSTNWGPGAGAFKIEANSDIASGAGTVYIDDIRFGTKQAPVWLDNFNDGAVPFNHGHDFECWSNLTPAPACAGVTFSPSHDGTVFLPPSGFSYRIAFATAAGLTDAVMLLPLEKNRGMDLTGTDSLAFYIRGSSAGANVGIGLKDASNFESVKSLTDYLPAGLSASGFEEVVIPLSHFAGLDKSRVTYLQVWFQKGGGPALSPASGFSVYLDNVRFVDTSSPTAPSALALDGTAVASGMRLPAGTSVLTMTAPSGAADPTLEHVGAEYSQDGALWYRIGVDTDTADGAYSVAWDTSKILPSAYQLRAFSEDTQGNRGVSSAVSVTKPSAPTLEHETLASVGIPGRDLKIAARLSSNRPVASLALFYRKTGDPAYSALHSTPTASVTAYEHAFTVPAASVTAAGLQYYLTGSDGVVAVSRGDAASPLSVSISDGAGGADMTSGQVVLYDGDQTDGETSVVVPAGALPFPRPITIRREEPAAAPLLAGKPPSEVYRFGPAGARFSVPVTLTLRYQDADGDGRVDSTGESAASLKIYWHDGTAWRPLGGRTDRQERTVTAQAQHFTLFGLFAADAAPSDSKPRERVITPNGDGVNDAAFFDNLPDDFTIRIFDRAGRLVRTLHNVAFWDGRDNGGDLVANGAYIYQVRVNFETVTGAIAVVR